MLLDVLLQENMDAELASQLTQPHTILDAPMAATSGITTTSNIHHTKKGLQSGNYHILRDCQSQDLQRSKEESESGAENGSKDISTVDAWCHRINLPTCH